MHASILRYFSAVAELGTIREASRRLHVSASAINRQILNLEELIGEPVFERRRTGMHLTEAGEIVLRHCRSTLQDFARMRSEIDARRGRIIGTVRILTLDSMTVQFLPQALARFHAAHPLVEMHVRSADPGATIGEVSRGKANIGFGFHDTRKAGALVVKRIRTPLQVLMHPEHPLAREPMVTLDECKGHSLIYQYHSTAVDSILGQEVQALRERSSPVVTSNTLALTKSLILSGVGIALYTAVGFLDEITEGRIVAVPVDDARLSSLEMALVVPKNRLSTVAAATLTSHLQGELGRFSQRLDRVHSKGPPFAAETPVLSRHRDRPHARISGPRADRRDGAGGVLETPGGVGEADMRWARARDRPSCRGRHL